MPTILDILVAVSPSFDARSAMQSGSATVLAIGWVALRSIRLYLAYRLYSKAVQKSPAEDIHKLMSTVAATPLGSAHHGQLRRTPRNDRQPPPAENK